jgi:hypothetical protein
MRNFETGATRNSDEGKMQYARIFDPGVERAFAEYMESQRVQADGKVRDPDNWKKGIPVPSYLDSQRRHWHDVWCLLSGRPDLAEEKDLVTALCALKFNVDGMLFEVLKDRQPAYCEIAHETIAEEDLCEKRRTGKAVEDADGAVTVEAEDAPVLLDSLTSYELRELLRSEKTAVYPDVRGEEIRRGRIINIERILQDRASQAYRKHPEWRVCK